MYSKKKAEDIQFKRSFYKFSFVFFFSLIIGLVGRYVIYTQPLDQFISKQISQNEDYKMDVQGIRIKLKQGWLPTLAIFADTLVVVDNNCMSRSLKAKNIFVSMDIAALLRSEIKPKSIHISELHLKTPEKCKKVPVATENQNFQNQDKPELAKKSGEKEKNSFPGDFFHFFKEQRSKIMASYLVVEKFHADIFREGDIEIAIHGEISFRNSKKNLAVNIYPNNIQFRHQDLPVSKGLISLLFSEEGFKLQYETFIREGKVELKASVANLKNFPVELTSRLTKIPISTFSPFFLAKTQLNYLWVNCQATVKADWEMIERKSFALEECGLSGPYGSIKVLQSEANLKKMKTMEIKFDKVDLDEIIKDKRGAYFSGIFSKYGKLSGALKHDDGKWNLKAQLENSDFLFSRNNRRELQKVEALFFEIFNNPEGWFLQTSGVKIANGVMKGKVKIAIDHELKNGRGEIAFHQARLDPSIYKLMLKSEASDFSIFGQVFLEQGKVSRWDGVIAANKIFGEKFSFSTLKIKAEQKKKKEPFIKVTSNQGEFKKGSELLVWLEPTVLGENWTKETMAFNELSAKVIIQEKQNWVWKRGYMQFANGWQLSSEGSVGRRGDIQGWLQWDVPQKPVIRWSYKGPFAEGRWRPEETWMKEWLKSNANFLSKHSSIDFVADNETEMTEDVKAMGKKLLEKAKSVLPIETKDKNTGS